MEGLLISLSQALPLDEGKGGKGFVFSVIQINKPT
jgi:hypothetical protein